MYGSILKKYANGNDLVVANTELGCGNVTILYASNNDGNSHARLASFLKR